MKLSLAQHGDERDAKTNGGYQKVKYCCRHGWLDLSLIGGEVVWQRLHRNCKPLITDDEREYKKAA